MTLVTDPFFLDLSVWSGIIILLLIIALAVFMFFKRSFNTSGVLSWFIGILLLYNGISFLIAGIPLFIGTLLVVGGGKR